ncbi:unnamed protein product [Victoria cruziana]
MVSSTSPSGSGLGCQVRCSGCREILNVPPGISEFSCPRCKLPQMLPPELLSKGSRGSAVASGAAPQGIDPTKIQLPCAHCKALLNVPHGLARFACPQCGVDLAVDLTKLQHYLSSMANHPLMLPGFGDDVAEEVNEVAEDMEREQDEGGTAGETFTDYRPSKLSIGPPHPDPVVETSSLSAVQPPDPTYELKIKDQIVKCKSLSCLQIETIIYSCQRHAQHLSSGARAGFFMGDGAGVGKGRTIAGLIWENWHHGRHKALWISVGSDLKFDARRDLDDVGASCIEVHPLNKLPYSKLDSKSVGIKEGVLFLTYSSLIASSEKGRSRLQQLIQWCGPEYDGPLIFDEARLPEARVVYCSATGASEPRNMGYMVRLGLWGAGTSFPQFHDFLAAEFWAELRVELLTANAYLFDEKPNPSLLWRLYWASHQRFFRHLCMAAKVPAAVRLAKQALLEDKCVVIGLQSTGEARTEEAVTKYGIEMDDFVSGPRELLLKLVEENYPLPQKPNAFPEEKKRLLCCSCCGKRVHSSCLVPPLVDLPVEKWSCPSCKEETDDYMQQRQAYLAEISKRYETAKERKSKILDIIRSLDLPNNPLDDIIDQLGGPDNVAELTGRRGMLVRASTGKGVVYQARNTKEVAMEMVNMHEKEMFMDGKKLVAIISEAGSAGVSLQADRRALNQKRRVHLTLELPWSADRAIQQLGRTHRSNQASAPQYRLLFTNLGGERRFASIVAKRLETLGALTQGDRRAGPSLSAYNYDSNYGKKALNMLYKAIMEQSDLPVMPPCCSPEKPDSIREYHMKAKAALVSVGIIRDSALGGGKDNGKITGRIVESDMNDVGRFLNRILGLPPGIQNRLFEFFVAILDILVHDARKEGQFDSGIVDIKGNHIELKEPPKTVYVDPTSGASTVLFTFTINRGLTWEGANKLLDQNQENGLPCSGGGFYESRREWMGKRHFLLAEMPLEELQSKYRKVSSLEKAQKGWQEEYEISSKQCMHGPKCKHGRFCTVGRRLQKISVLGGLILPVWGTVEKALTKQVHQRHTRLRVVRLETTEERQRVVGLLVPNIAVASVLQDLRWVQDLDP